ncbi:MULTISPECIES: preATP grasp domain-containing protein [Bacillus cereus group]|uniref:preATP grasp domain-containing protein n=1 Tax=Bacillus cereus group TaxID=86661 RepID=UPI0011C98390|nr:MULTISPECIES: hypothetical protein [Bacillus cereus group]QWG81537.1 hypothetical protein EXW27_29085 [Bacillus mycoides]TXR81552.1 hypothetical protein DN408_13440 [Bacillus sp. AR13-1]
MKVLMTEDKNLEHQKKSGRKIIIGNVDGESLVGETKNHTPYMLASASIVANRLSWFVEEGDVLLLPYPISREFQEYMCKLLRIDPDKIHILSPNDFEEEETKLLTFDVLTDEKLYEKVQKLAGSGETLGIFPYYFDRAVAQLSKSMNTNVYPHTVEFLLQGGSEVLNSKVEFRRIAASHNIPVAEGMNCYSSRELQKSILSLITKTGSVIVKQDVNAGGDGNIVLTKDIDKKESKGAFETIYFNQNIPIEETVSYLWSKLIGFRNSALVVEVYYETVGVYYSELAVSRQNLRPLLLNFGDMRMEPVWNGFEIPTSTMDPYTLAEFISSSTALANVARERGYEGNINIDGLLTTEGKLMISEINGRNGGCSHIHFIAQKLYGENYAKDYKLLTRNKIKAGKSFAELLKLLLQEDLLVTKAYQEGVIILTEDFKRTETIEYMVVGKGDMNAKKIEDRALQLFKTLNL